jgi:chromosome segregation ATPase
VTTTDTYEEFHCSSGSNEPSNHILVQQVLELRRRLDDDHQSYKRKLQHYQESQQKQAQLVAKLQQKILQYKTKCTELEHSIESKSIEMERIRVGKKKMAFLFNFIFRISLLTKSITSF